MINVRKVKKMNEQSISMVNDILRDACEKRLIPGAVFLAGNGNDVLFHQAYGCAQWIPDELPMTEDTRFDLASLTKVTATWPCIVRLLEAGELDLEMTLPEMLDDWDIPESHRWITLFHLLTHTAGLTEDEDVDTFGATRAERVRATVTFPLKYPAGEVHYSDLGFILLGEIVSKKTGLPLDQAARRIWDELGMTHTTFNPPKDLPFASTEIVNGVTTRGTVHDERAQQLFGVAGHAGAFSTAGDLGIYCRQLLPGRHSLICSDEWLRRSFKLHVPDETWNRGLAWVVHRETPEGSLIGHTGFTGTSLHVDTVSGDYDVLLTNRVHPTRANKNLQAIRMRIRHILYGLPE